MKAVLKNTRRSSVSSPLSLSRSFNDPGARIQSATSPLRTHRPSFNHVWNPAILVGTMSRWWHCQANTAQLLAERLSPVDDGGGFRACLVGGQCSDRAPPHRLPACTVIGDDRKMTFVQNVDSGVPCALETLVSGSPSGES